MVGWDGGDGWGGGGGPWDCSVSPRPHGFGFLGLGLSGFRPGLDNSGFLISELKRCCSSESVCGETHHN